MEKDLNRQLIDHVLETADNALRVAVLELWRHKRGPSDEQAKDNINEARRTLNGVRLQLLEGGDDR